MCGSFMPVPYGLEQGCLVINLDMEICKFSIFNHNCPYPGSSEFSYELYQEPENLHNELARIVRDGIKSID